MTDIVEFERTHENTEGGFSADHSRMQAPPSPPQRSCRCLFGILLRRSRNPDLGRTWGPATILWQEVIGADVEPGGYQWASVETLWFVASTDEDSVGRTYTNAIVKRKANQDGGATWGSPITLVPVEDQIVFGVTPISSDQIGLATVRHYSGGSRTAAFYRVPVTRPGEVLCSDSLFVSGFEYGLPGGWNLIRP